MRAELLENLSDRCCVIAALNTRWVVLTLIGYCLSLSISATSAREPDAQDNASSRETQSNAKRRIPLQHMRRDAQELVNDVIDNPSFFRRMPTQIIQCDPQMFKFIVRYPEVLVNIWDVMGITKVQIKRTGPYTFIADDSVGTTCKCDLIYGNEQVHVYYGSGAYNGNMAPRQVTGRCICVLHSSASTSASGEPIISGSMDVFLKLDNLGADLLTRTLAPFVGKTADYNFIESAKFISQISQVCELNPEGAQVLASKLQKIDPEVRDEFARLATQVSEAAQNRYESQQLATLGPPRAQLTARDVVPVPEFQAGTDFRMPHKYRQGNVGLIVNDNTLVQVEDKPQSDHRPRVQVSDSTAVTKDSANARAPSAVTNNTKNPLLPVAPERAIAPAKPSIYMRR